MLRYSTPTITLETTLNLDNFVGFWLSLEQDDIILRKTKKDLVILGNEVSFSLSQEETAMFTDKKLVKIQLRWISLDGKSGGTELTTIRFGEVIEDEVMTIENSN